MKRRYLIRYPETRGCEFLGEGGNHTVYVNRALKKTSTAPRHKEINDFLVYKICKDIGEGKVVSLDDLHCPKEG